MDAAAVVYEKVRTVSGGWRYCDFTERELRVCVESARKFIGPGSSRSGWRTVLDGRAWAGVIRG